MQKLYTNEKLSLQFAIFVLVQPIIDIYRLFVGNGIEVAGVSLVELINIILIVYMGILFILNQKKLKSFAPAFVYALLFAVYLVVHCHNVLAFDTSVISGANINVWVEIYVIVRMYVLPIAFLYMLVFIKTSEQRFLKTMVYSSCFISFVIVITNLLKVSYISYASNLKENEMIHQNIIEWFTKRPPENLNLITSKGWFYSGNQIGIVLLMLFPILIYYAFQKKKFRWYLMAAIQMVAMIMVSTKTAALGAVIIIFITVMLQIIFSVYEKSFKKNWLSGMIILMIGVGGILLIDNAPVKSMIYSQEISYLKGAEEEGLEDEAEGFLGEDFDAAGFSKFMNKYYYIYGIQEEYIRILPVQQYPKFWLSVISDKNKNQVNFRNFKKTILAEVLKYNDNDNDKWLGIGYTTNFPYMERDITAQNAWFGIIGTVLLLGPFALIFVICLLQICLHFKENFKLINCILGLSLCGAFGAALMAGHLFGYIFPITIFIYILAQLYQQTFKGWRKRKTLTMEVMNNTLDQKDIIEVQNGGKDEL